MLGLYSFAAGSSHGSTKRVGQTDVASVKDVSPTHATSLLLSKGIQDVARILESGGHLSRSSLNVCLCY
jgi:hypothetical protein